MAMRHGRVPPDWAKVLDVFDTAADAYMERWETGESPEEADRVAEAVLEAEMMRLDDAGQLSVARLWANRLWNRG